MENRIARIEKQLDNVVKRLETTEAQSQTIFERLRTIEAQMKVLKPSGPEPPKQPPQRPRRIAYNPLAKYDDDPRFLKIAGQEGLDWLAETKRAKTEGDEGQQKETPSL